MSLRDANVKLFQKEPKCKKFGSRGLRGVWWVWTIIVQESGPYITKSLAAFLVLPNKLFLSPLAHSLSFTSL
jgi:hypothetical protein